MQIAFLPKTLLCCFSVPASAADVWSCYLGPWNRHSPAAARSPLSRVSHHWKAAAARERCWKRKLLVAQVNCGVVPAFSDAEVGSDKISQVSEDSSQAVQLAKAGVLQVSIREARFGDYWEVADTHCSAFLPDQRFPIDVMMRFDRFMSMFGNFSLPPGRKRMCLVAVDGQSSDGSADLLAGDQCRSPDCASDNEQLVDRIMGILTVDTVAEFLPRQKPSGIFRTGIAYISNVAVWKTMRRRGIAKQLIQESEVVARGWGCRSVALHCDISNQGAVALYLGAGYKLVKDPVGAKWPKPRATPGSDCRLMLKRLAAT